MVYEYKWNGMKRAVPADVVGKHLLKLENQYGEVTPELFLESARDKKSKMHSLFEWDDTAAAEKYRLYQARTIICSLHVSVIHEDTEPVVLRGFVQDKKTSAGYVNVERAMSEPDKRKRILEQAKKEMQWFVEKYKAFEELSKVIEAIQEFCA